MNYFKRFFTLICFILLGTSTIYSKSRFIDSTDNAFDMSEHLNTISGFMPIPIVITEPAVGYGGGLAILYFHNKDSKTKGITPVVSAAAGGYTSNGTWFSFLAHKGSYQKDFIRYTGAAGYVAPNLKLYGSGAFEDVFLNFNINGLMFYQEGLLRVNNKIPFFAGLNYIYFNSELRLDTDKPVLEDFSIETNVGELKSSFLFDNRNNAFTPTNGILSALNIGKGSKIFGGDNEYWHLMTRNYGYTDIVDKKLFAGLRLAYESKWGDVPFYLLPSVDLRGIPAMRYQGNNVFVAETEWTWNLYKRWSVVGFTGAGFTAPEVNKFDISNGKVSGGLGFRYFIAREYGTHAGLDFAVGPDTWAWYIVFGGSWH